jgi:hypothetical protein
MLPRLNILGIIKGMGNSGEVLPRYLHFKNGMRALRLDGVSRFFYPNGTPYATRINTGQGFTTFIKGETTIVRKPGKAEAYDTSGGMERRYG